MEDICLENIWKGRLKLQGWSNEAIQGVLGNWARSTLSVYSSHVRAFVRFSMENGIDPGKCSPELVAQFFVQVADRSTRPKALLDSNSAALSCYFNALD